MSRTRSSEPAPTDLEATLRRERDQLAQQRDELLEQVAMLVQQRDDYRAKSRRMQRRCDEVLDELRRMRKEHDDLIGSLPVGSVLRPTERMAVVTEPPPPIDERELVPTSDDFSFLNPMIESERSEGGYRLKGDEIPTDDLATWTHRRTEGAR